MLDILEAIHATTASRRTHKPVDPKHIDQLNDIPPDDLKVLRETGCVDGQNTEHSPLVLTERGMFELLSQRRGNAPSVKENVDEPGPVDDGAAADVSGAGNPAPPAAEPAV